jgi:hypothetical protein
MENTISADSIINRLKNGQTDFRDLGKCRVIGEFTHTGTIVIENVPHLGELIFEEEVSFNGFEFNCDEIFFDKVIFKNDFILGASCIIQHITMYLESATFEAGIDFNCNPLDCSIHLGSVNILGEILCVGALCEETWIYAGDRPAIAWVLQQAMLSNIQFQIADAPPWLQRPMTPLN